MLHSDVTSQVASLSCIKRSAGWNPAIRKGKNMAKKGSMIRVYLVNGVDHGLLEGVKAEMLVLGSPTIRVYDAQDYYYALEGTHRLAAAADLGLPVKFDVIDGDDEIDLRTLDLDENNWASHWERDIPVPCDELVSRMAEFQRDHVVDVEIG